MSVEPLTTHRVVTGADGRPVLVKRATTPEGAARLAGEGAVLTALAHPSVVQVVDQREGELHLAWVGPHSLATVAGLPVTSAGVIVGQVAAVVADLHRAGIGHGRLTADHVLLADGRVVLTGLADAGRLERVPAADDVAALGTLLTALVAPHEEQMVPDRRRSRSDGGRRATLLTLADRATADDPASRPTAADLATELAALCAPRPTRRSRRRHPAPPPPLPVPTPPGPAASRSGLDCELPHDVGPTDEPVIDLTGPTPRIDLGTTPLDPPHPVAAPSEPEDDRPLWPLTEAPVVAPEPCSAPSPRPIPSGTRAFGPSPRRPAVPTGRSIAAAVLAVTVAATVAAALWIAPSAAEPGDQVVTPTTSTVPPSTTTSAPPLTTAAPAPTTTTAPDCAPISAPAVADVDGDGCVEAVTIVGERVSVGPVTWVVGRPGDVVVVGDWDCDATATPASLRPDTGEVFVFDRWPGGDEQLTIDAVATVPDARTLRPSAAGEACPTLVAQRADGSTEEVVTR